MILEVKRYNRNYDYHECEDEDGNLRRLDLMVDGSVDGILGPQDFVDKRVSVERISTYIGLAMGVRLEK